jgi:protein gp37
MPNWKGKGIKKSIGWADKTYNPVSGCLNNCDQGQWCYARKMSKRLAGRFGYPADDPFRPVYHSSALTRMITELMNTRTPKRIFVCSMGDLGSVGVEQKWINNIFAAIGGFPQHRFLFLTKRPEVLFERLPWWEFGAKNVWFGVSVVTQKDVWRIDELKDLYKGFHKFVSFEPLHSAVEYDLKGIEWAIIGAETGNRAEKITPAEEWIYGILKAAERGNIPVYLKDNLKSATPYIPPHVEVFRYRHSKKQRLINCLCELQRKEFPEDLKL